MRPKHGAAEKAFPHPRRHRLGEPSGPYLRPSQSKGGVVPFHRQSSFIAYSVPSLMLRLWGSAHISSVASAWHKTMRRSKKRLARDYKIPGIIRFSYLSSRPLPSQPTQQIPDTPRPSQLLFLATPQAANNYHSISFTSLIMSFEGRLATLDVCSLIPWTGGARRLWP
jgi:hypothetical protein